MENNTEKKKEIWTDAMEWTAFYVRACSSTFLQENCLTD